MADTSADGMLLNFSIAEEIKNARPKLKGGRWRDRLLTKRAIPSRIRKTERLRKPADLSTLEEKPTSVKDISAANSAEAPLVPTAKRQKLDREQNEATDDRPSRLGGIGPERKTVNYARKDQGGMISSLFTSNPLPRSAEEHDKEDAGPAEPSNAPLADGISDFLTLGLEASVALQLLKRLELKAPTAIQKAAIPQLLREDCDAFIQAETGSGKTLAYLLPIVQRIIRSSSRPSAGERGGKKGAIHRDSGLFAIILAPTRELSRQIAGVLEKISHCAHWIVSGTVLGGEKKKSEKARIRKGLNILVATPGRLADHLENTKVLDVSKVSWLVLDEGDRLMEMGFEADIQKIVGKLQLPELDGGSDGHSLSTKGFPSRRVTILCSATMSTSVQKLGEISLHGAAHIKANVEDDTEGRQVVKAKAERVTFSTPAQLQQSYTIVPAKLRLVTLTAVLRRSFHRRGSVMKAIIFFSCADSVDYHFILFARPPNPDSAEETGGTKNHPTDHTDANKTTTAQAGTLSTGDANLKIYKLHGSLQQPVRTSTLRAFAHTKEPSVLLCTDVASRGLDLPNIDLVIEYDPACSRDDHLHRVGRTARAGKPGRTLIFLLPGSEEGYVKILKEIHDGAKALSRADPNDLLRKGFASAGLNAGTDWDRRATDWQMDIERWLLKDERSLQMARKAYQSHIRAYATHIANERHIFDLKNLHLGHLAKSFGLRDPPGNINASGLRGAKDHRDSERKRKLDMASNGTGIESDQVTTNQRRRSAVESKGAGEASKMRKKMQEHMAAASEFNID